jgi:tRNA threonylcarbamoyladenosine biosynthesis protein TsaB
MNVLFIDTSNNKEVIVSLHTKDMKETVKQEMDKNKAQIVLPIIETLLIKYTLTFHDLTEIKVQEGPGSFTGLRVGITIANTLGSFLRIPINGRNIGELVMPKYE